VKLGPQGRTGRRRLTPLAPGAARTLDADRRSKSDWIVIQLEAVFAKRTRRTEKERHTLA
jgi:hypothetical protein